MKAVSDQLSAQPLAKSDKKMSHKKAQKGNEKKVTYFFIKKYD